MLVGILALRASLFFRPLLAWADKFKFESMPGEDIPESRLPSPCMQRSRITRYIGRLPGFLWNLSLPIFSPAQRQSGQTESPSAAAEPDWPRDHTWNRRSSALVAAYALIRCIVGQFVKTEVPLDEVLHVFFLASITALRVLVLIALGLVGLGADRRLDRRAAQTGAARAAGRAIPGGVPGADGVLAGRGHLHPEITHLSMSTSGPAR